MSERLPDPGCIACGSNGERFEWSSRWQLHRCNRCGVVYPADWRVQLGDADFHEGNEAYYRRLGNCSLSGLTERRIRELLGELGRMVPARTLLDVGCGRGECVEVASRLGWRAHGIDLAQAAIDLCRERSLPCTCTSFFADELSGQRFGLIVMSELIEHVPNAKEFLERALELLLPGGVLYLTTPNFDSLGRRVFGDQWSGFGAGHVALRNPDGVARLARDVGFRPLRIESANLSPAAVRQLARRGRPSLDAGPGTRAATAVGQRTQTEALRRRVYGSRLLLAAKRVADVGVRVSGLGETVRARLVKPAER